MRHNVHVGGPATAAYDDRVQDSVLDVDGNLKPLRRDAARNRELILGTAAEAFAEQGLDVGYDEIARRAGVGVGTVYRRFPQRSELIRALFETRIDEMVRLAQAAVHRPEAWPALCWFLEKACSMQAADRGLKEVLAGSSHHSDSETYARARLVPPLTVLLDRAKGDGRLRTDVEPSDIGAVMMVISSLSTRAQPELWRRYLALFLDALCTRPGGSAMLPMAAPGDDEMVDLIHGPHSRRH